jgi:hypothetical protein
VVGGTLTLCHENDRLEWMRPEEIPWEELAFPSTVSALRDVLARRTDRRHARNDALST